MFARAKAKASAVELVTGAWRSGVCVDTDTTVSGESDTESNSEPVKVASASNTCGLTHATIAELGSVPCGSWGRLKMPWSEVETNALKEGMKEFLDRCKDPWKRIKRKYGEILGERTTVDLKDKARNIKKAEEKANAYNGL